MNTPVQRLAFSVREACAATGLSRSTIYNLLREGTLQKRKVRGRTLICSTELTRLLQLDQSNTPAEREVK